MASAAGPRVLYCSSAVDSGYGIAARRTVRALVAAGVDVCWLPGVRDPDERWQPVERRVLGDPVLDACWWQPGDGPAPPMVIIHELPDAVPQIRALLRPEVQIAFIVWETETLPPPWTEHLAGSAQVWAPCRWNVATFRAAGLLTPPEPVPHPVDPTIAAGSARAAARRAGAAAGRAGPAAGRLPLDIPEELFVVTTIGSWCERKAPDRTVEAFCRAFRGVDPVVLVIKTGALAWGIETDERAPPRFRSTVWWELQRLLARHNDPPRVVLATEAWSADEITALHRRTDCYLSLARAEGWGLGAFDAASAGVPVVMTGHGGQLDYLGDDHPGLVPFRLVPAIFPTMEGLFTPDMTWAEPDVEAAAALLRDIWREADHPCRQAAVRHGQELPERFSEAAVGATAARLLADAAVQQGVPLA